MKKIIALVMAFCLAFGGAPAVMAEETIDPYSGIEGSGSYTYVAPWVSEEELSVVYDDNIVVEEIPVLYSSGNPEYTADLTVIADQMREKMVAREKTAAFYYEFDSAPVLEIIEAKEEELGREITNDEYVSIVNAYLKELVNGLRAEAFKETGVSVEGDYLYRHVGRIGLTYSWSYRKPYFKVIISFSEKAGKDMLYFSTAEQEAELTKAIEEVKAGFGFTDKTNDYEKVKTIYDYITANVTYDWANLNNDANLVKFSAYGALINKTCVCQGYASLLYRFLTEEGISVRIIGGTSQGKGHAWNIVRLGDYYYNADSTWDAGRAEYEYFLCGKNNFDDHTRDAECDTAEFHSAHPMSETDFDPNTLPKDYTVTYDANGGTGAPSSETVAAGENTVITDVVPEKEGYVFLGWAAAADAAKAEYKAGDQYSNGEDITLYAVWEENPYIASGYCGGEGDGTNLSWTLDKKGLLTISGTGAMADYERIFVRDEATGRYYAKTTTPWVDYKGTVKTIVLEEGMTTVGSYAFYSMALEGELVLPKTLKSIGNWGIAVNNFTGDLVIPEGFESLKTAALQGVGDFEDVSIPSTLTSIIAAPFRYCRVKNINVAESNPNFKSVDGIMFDKTGTKLIQFPDARTGEYTVPEEVSHIGSSAFDTSDLSKVVVKGNVTMVESMAFNGFSGKVFFEGEVNRVVFEAFGYPQDGDTDIYFLNGPPKTIEIDEYGASFGPGSVLYYLKGTEDKWEFDENGLWNGYEVHEYDPGAIETGDTNGDGVINARDSQRLYEYIVGKNKTDDETVIKAMDVNGDGVVNARDSQRLYEHIIGKNPLD
ncbi:MAG: InlB B-repeat-containing protein [Oscillospiraceae bacterium]|nr:InlB B-repeat-containing protein [Oscillospiraceae bacterium]